MLYNDFRYWCAICFLLIQINRNCLTLSVVSDISFGNIFTSSGVLDSLIAFFFAIVELIINGDFPYMWLISGILMHFSYYWIIPFFNSIIFWVRFFEWLPDVETFFDLMMEQSQSIKKNALLIKGCLTKYEGRGAFTTRTIITVFRRMRQLPPPPLCLRKMQLGHVGHNSLYTHFNKASFTLNIY